MLLSLIRKSSYMLEYGLRELRHKQKSCLLLQYDISFFTNFAQLIQTQIA